MKGIDYYPIYALSPEDGYKPYAEMSDILEVFCAGRLPGALRSGLKARTASSAVVLQRNS